MRKGTHTRRLLYALTLLAVGLVFGTSVKIEGCCRGGVTIQFMVMLAAFFGSVGVSYLVQNVHGRVYYWRIEAA